MKTAKNASTLHAQTLVTTNSESGDGAWYCTNCKADCGLCSGVVLKDHKAVQCDSCDMWFHNECSFIAETQYETVSNTNCTWICPKCEFSNFSDSFFGEQVNLETENRFVRSFFVCCLAHRGSTVGFLLLQCSSGVVRHPRDLQVSVATRFCRVLIFASSQYLSVIYLFHVMIH